MNEHAITEYNERLTRYARSTTRNGAVPGGHDPLVLDGVNSTFHWLEGAAAVLGRDLNADIAEARDAAIGSNA